MLFLLSSVLDRPDAALDRLRARLVEYGLRERVQSRRDHGVRSAARHPLNLVGEPRDVVERHVEVDDRRILLEQTPALYADTTDP
jgi:hypothetical protein